MAKNLMSKFKADMLVNFLNTSLLTLNVFVSKGEAVLLLFSVNNQKFVLVKVIV